MRPYTPMALLLSGALAAAAGAQAAASPAFFIPAVDQAAGGQSTSGTFSVVGCFGNGLVPTRATTSLFTLQGGFATMVDTPTTGRPWVTGALPQYPTLRGGSPHTIYGTQLDLGPSTTVAVGAVPAPVNARAAGTIDITMPHVIEGGALPIEVVNAGGRALQPEVMSVLPMIETDGPFRNFEANRVRYRGRQGDAVVWALADGLISPVSLFPYEGLFRLNLLTLIASDLRFVNSPDGILYLDLPPVELNVAIFFQAFVFSNDIGYLPGAFTNITFVSPF
jgi:hypothetical protein